MTNDKKTAVWFITGCSTGLGRALAEHLLGRGDRVAMTARDTSQLESLSDKYGDLALPLRLDLADVALIEASVAAAEARFGRIDVLVNNAG